MDRDKQIMIGVVVLSGLGALVYRQVGKDADAGKPVTKVELPEIKGSDDLDKISITNGEKGEVVLEKKGEGDKAQWVMTKPVNAPANQQNIKSLIDNAKELKAKEVIADKADDAIKKEYQLDA